MPLNILKDSNPVEVAKFSVARGIFDELAFSWWVPFTLKKRDVIISDINSRVRKKTHEFGIEVLMYLENSKLLDAKSVDNLRQDAIAKEMYQVLVNFNILEDGESPPPGWEKSTDNIIFDAKMDFMRKARWVKDGHCNPDSETSSYAGVVSLDIIQIALRTAASQGVYLLSADNRNEYFQSPSSDKNFIICGLEFGS